LHSILAAADAGQPVHVGEQTWGVWGPHAITHFLGETGEIARALPQVALYPYSFALRRKLVTGGVNHSRAITDDTQSVHLYGRRIRKRLAEKDQGLPEPDSLVGQYLIQHRIDPCDAPLRDYPNPDRNHPFAKIYRAAVSAPVYASAEVKSGDVRPLDDVVAVTTMRNEGAFILDWVAYRRKPHQAWGFKTIFRREAPFNAFGVHRPQDPSADMPAWTNGSGQQMPERYLREGWRSGIDCWGYDLVTLHHYAVRSCDSFLVKRDRGRANHIARPQDIAYWNTYNRNDAEDTSILPRLGLARSARQVFARDPVIGPLHAKAVAWHKARIAALKASPREAAFLKAVTADPLSHTVDEVELPECEVVPPTSRQVTGDVFQIRKDPPATGRAAVSQFQGLMQRTQPKQGMFEPLRRAPNSDRVVVVTSMKNEGCFVLEWVAYHLSIGVTHFVVYTNDCDDPTNAILDQLQALGVVTRRDNPFNRKAGQKPQRGALNDAATLPEVMGADWVGVIDVDEFVNIHVGDGTFADLLEAAHDPNVISMTWRFFGNRGVHAYEDSWQVEQFTACAPLYIPKPRLGWGFKSFFRPDGAFSRLGVHRPLGLDETRADEVRWVNGAGRRMPDRVLRKNEWFSRKDTIGYDMVTLNHYVLRSAESFLVKRQRGRINHVDQDQGMTYWSHRNYATETDVSILAHVPRARVEFDRLVADVTLRDLHAASVDWHRGRIAQLMGQDDYRALYDAITNPHLPDAIWRDRVSAPAQDDPVEAAE